MLKWLHSTLNAYFLLLDGVLVAFDGVLRGVRVAGTGCAGDCSSAKLGGGRAAAVGGTGSTTSMAAFGGAIGSVVGGSAGDVAAGTSSVDTGSGGMSTAAV